MFPNIGRFRTNLFQQRSQWCLAMRFVKSLVPSFEELGLLEQIKKVAESPRGIVLVAGSTGCGKSTTLAAMVEHINSNFKKHIITLEDPVEYAFEDNQSVIEQREIGLDTLSYHLALKHVLRQDPDIIMIGEMRDDISFAAAMSAADTGHLVLSTLHTTNASQSITRILDFFKAEEREQIRRQLATALRGVICQRMVTTVDGKLTPALEILLNTPLVRKLLEENRLDKLPAAIETGNGRRNAHVQPVAVQSGQGRARDGEGSVGQGQQPAGAGDEFQGQKKKKKKKKGRGMVLRDAHVQPVSVQSGQGRSRDGERGAGQGQQSAGAGDEFQRHLPRRRPPDY